MKYSLFLILLPVVAGAADKDAVGAAVQDHRWFDLRDTVVARKAQPFDRLITAAVFNDVRGAERELPAVMRSGNPHQLGEVHYQLYRLYNRIGQYRKAAEEQRKAWSVGWTPSEEARADADALEKLPDLEVVSRRPATTSYFEWPGRKTVVVPVTVNGHPTRFGIDSAAGVCLVTETLAKRLGLKTSPGQPLFDGITGKQSTAGRYAVADRLKIGNTEFHNVSFLVLADDLDVLQEIPLEERGVIGLPILLGVETIRWNRGHRLDIGFAPAHATLRAANLAFEALFPLVAVEVAGRRLSFEFDTGAEATTLWPPFAKEFPDALQNAHKGSRYISGATGGSTRDATILPKLRIRVAGFPIVLEEAPALLAPTILASNLHYGLFAMDALSKADEVTLDFRAMRVDLR